MVILKMQKEKKKISRRYEICKLRRTVSQSAVFSADVKLPVLCEFGAAVLENLIEKSNKMNLN